MPHRVPLRPRLLALAAMTALAVGCRSAAPTPPAPAVTAAVGDTAAASRDQAIALLDRAVRALGGSDAVLGARGVEVEIASRNASSWLQARSWRDSAPWLPVTQRYLIDLVRQRTRFESDQLSPGEIRFDLLTLVDTAGAQQVDLLRWRTGSDIARNPAPAARAALAGYGRLLPHLAVRQARLAEASLRAGQRRAAGGRTVDVVSYSDPATGAAVELELDAATALPSRLVVPSTRSAVEWEDYRRVDGVSVAFHRVLRVGDQVANDQRLTRVSLRPDLADARFRLPPGYADPPAPGAPHATRLAEGVYRLDDMPSGYHAGFVVRDAGVVVFEAPQNAQFTAAALDVIGRTAPGKPVTHVLISHHHVDHVGGLAPYVARGAVVVLGAGLEEAIRRQLPDSLRARVRFEPVDAVRPVGTTGVVGLPVPNTHADGNVAYFVPGAGVLFQGDMFYIPERGDVPPAFGVTDALAAVVRANALIVRTVVGVHGRSGSWAEVEESLRKRREPGR